MNKIFQSYKMYLYLKMIKNGPSSNYQFELYKAEFNPFPDLLLIVEI